MNSIRVGCIVVNYFKEDLTEKCIRSLASSAGEFSLDCIVVDNGSRRKLDFDFIDNSGVKVETVAPNRNLGFAEGCNLAAEILLDRPVQYLLLLNNDAEAARDTIEQLVKGIELSPDICATTGKIQFGGPKRLDYWYAGARLSRFTGRPSHCNSGNETFDRIDKEGLVLSVPFISGCCLFMRADLVRVHGLFRGGLFAYGEDLDWCLRMTALGYRLGYVGRAIVTHHVSSSFRSDAGKTLTLAHFLSARNLLLVNRLHFTGMRLSLALLLNVINCLAYSLAFLVAGESGKSVAIAKGVVLGLLAPVPPIGRSASVNFGIPGDLFPNRQAAI